MSIEIEILARNEFLKEKYKASLYHTCKYLLGYKDVNPRTHGDMIRALEAPTKRKLIVMPRGTFKSTIGVVGYSIWILMNNPDARILIDSEVYTNSKNFLREIKAQLLRPEFIELFGDWRGPVWSEGEIVIAPRTATLKDPSISCGGVETIKVGAHFDYIIHDDLNSNKNSATQEGRKKVIEHYQLNTSILEPNGTMVIIGTRYSMADVIQHVLDNEINARGLL